MAEHRVGSAATLLKDGEMTRLELEGKPVVVVRAEGKYYAFGGNCPHYGAPLNDGVLKGHELICPWHHACFDVRSAVRLEPPTLNDLARFPVRLDGDDVVVTLPHDNERQPQGKRDPEDERHFVIIGGGAGGNAAAEELRRAGYRGAITILSAAETPPVDRPNLSKDYLAGEAEPDWIPLRDKQWYAERDIDLRLKTTVTGIDTTAHTVTLANGEALHYHKLLLATGGIPRDLTGLPGGKLENILTLRTLADSNRILERAKQGQRAVVIGASFIGMEVAASLAKGQKLAVKVTAPEKVPFEKVLGDRVGKMFLDEHSKNGIEFRLGEQVEAFEGEQGKVTGVRLKGGDVLPADFVVVGIGVRPATDFLKVSQLRMSEKDNSIEADETLQTSDPDVYAAGDIAHYATPDGRERIEHWRTAQQHGIVAGRNLLGSGEDVNQRVPFFWTNQWDIKLRYVGHATEWDEIIYRGDPAEQQFLAFYVKSGRLKAATGMGHDRDLDALEFILKDGMALTPDEMANEQFDLVAYAVSG